MLDKSIKAELLAVARTVITLGAEGKERDLNIEKYSSVLREHRASFVTLTIDGQLKGCIGSLQAYKPLALDVAGNAYAAAFEDSRFSPVTFNDLDKISIQVSVLSVPEKIEFTSEQDLIKQLKPGEDGLILQDDYHRGTFLPSVWEQLPNSEEFLRHLKNKAGLAKDYWSNDIDIQRYTTESFSEN